MSSTDDIIVCANCGKGEGEESAGDLKSCTACKLVKYCNRDCQIVHRPQHKKACKKRAAELYEEALFNEPPPNEECPICMLLLPIAAEEHSFESCCGKIICMGCIHAMAMEEVRKGKKKEEMGMCPYCRTPQEGSSDDHIERIDKLMKNGNADAFYVYAGDFSLGRLGLQQDQVKANELLLKAGELGCAKGYSRLGYSYDIGAGVERNEKKAKHYYGIAAMKGEVKARHNLGLMEGKAGNFQRRYKHMIIAARAGDPPSLDKVKKGFTEGHVTKDEYESTLRAYHERQTEMKSDMRELYIAYRERTVSR